MVEGGGRKGEKTINRHRPRETIVDERGQLVGKNERT